jgi:hypothetical protein
MDSVPIASQILSWLQPEELIIIVKLVSKTFNKATQNPCCWANALKTEQSFAWKMIAKNQGEFTPLFRLLRYVRLTDETSQFLVPHLHEYKDLDCIEIRVPLQRISIQEELPRTRKLDVLVSMDDIETLCKFPNLTYLFLRWLGTSDQSSNQTYFNCFQILKSLEVLVINILSWQNIQILSRIASNLLHLVVSSPRSPPIQERLPEQMGLKSGALPRAIRVKFLGSSDFRLSFYHIIEILMCCPALRELFVSNAPFWPNKNPSWITFFRCLGNRPVFCLIIPRDSSRTLWDDIKSHVPKTKVFRHQDNNHKFGTNYRGYLASSLAREWSSGWIVECSEIPRLREIQMSRKIKLSQPPVLK